jgi:hypothetical protein
MPLTQCQRVERALDEAGANGITQVDFLLPDVIDGGKPITRVGARIYDLRKKRGLAIVELGHRDSCTIYMLAKYQRFPSGSEAAAVTKPAERTPACSESAPPAVAAATSVPGFFDDEEFLPAETSQCAIDDDFEQAA